MNYDLSLLSPIDFEELMRDVFAARTGRQVESFPPGPDGGVDLRWNENGHISIVQCKHYMNSSFSKLKSAVRDEVVKLAAMKERPHRYRLVTTSTLTAANKRDLAALLAPYIESDSDIWGLNDVIASLRDNESVVRQHPKLFVPSAAALFWSVNSEIASRSEYLRSSIKDAAASYAKTSHFDDARLRLDRHRTAVIAGPAGAGKSTLAMMLVGDHLDEGFEPINIQRNVSEGWRAMRTGCRQIFLFDDFLGQYTAQSLLAKNEDLDLSRLFDRVRSDPEKRLILTSRDHILDLGLLRYAPIEQIVDAKILVKVCEMTTVERARVLFNHLCATSAISDEVKAEVRKGFNRLVYHRNFSPRRIAAICDRDRLTPGFISRSIELLDDDAGIYREPYRSSTFSVRILLWAAAVCDDGSALQSVLPVFQSLGRLYATPTDPIIFNESLRSSEGVFLKTHTTVEGVSVRYLNPSVREFIVDELFKDPILLRHLLDSVQSLAQFRTLLEAADRAEPTGTRQRRARFRRVDNPDILALTLGKLAPLKDAVRAAVLRLVALEEMDLENIDYCIELPLEIRPPTTLLSSCLLRTLDAPTIDNGEAVAVALSLQRVSSPQESAQVGAKLDRTLCEKVVDTDGWEALVEWVAESTTTALAMESLWGPLESFVDERRRGVEDAGELQRLAEISELAGLEDLALDVRADADDQAADEYAESCYADEQMELAKERRPRSSAAQTFPADRIGAIFDRL